MKCKACESEVQIGKFCTLCGTKAEEVEQEQGMKVCTTCSESIQEEANFCKYCGKAQEQAAVEEAAVTVEEAAPTTEELEPTEEAAVTEELATVEEAAQTEEVAPIEELASAAEEPISVEETMEVEVQPEEKTEKKTTKGKWIIGLSGVVVLFIVLISMAFMQQAPIEGIMYYTKTDGEIFLEAQKGTYIELDDVMGYVYFNKEMDVMTYLEDDTLMQQNVKGKAKAKEIDDDIESYVVSEDGSTIVALRDYDYGYEKGELVYYKNGKEVAVLSEDAHGRVVMSPDGTYVAFNENDDYEMTLFLSKNGKEPVEITEDDSYILEVTNKGEVLCINNKLDVILFDSKQKETKLIDDVWGSEDIVSNPTLDRIFAINDDSELGVYQNKEWQTIEKDVHQVFSTIVDDVQFIQFTTYDNEVGIIFEDKSILELGEVYTDYYPSIQMDNTKTLMFLDEKSDLYRVALKAKAKPEKIASDVVHYGSSPSGVYTYYIDEDGEAYVQKNNKKPEQVADDVESMVVDNAGNIYFIDYDKELFWVDKKGKAVSVEDDIWYIDGWKDGTVTVRDEDNTLLRVNKDKKLEELLDDVEYLYLIEKTNHPAAQKFSLSTNY